MASQSTYSSYTNTSLAIVKLVKANGRRHRYTCSWRSMLPLRGGRPRSTADMLYTSALERLSLRIQASRRWISARGSMEYFMDYSMKCPVGFPPFGHPEVAVFKAVV